MTTILLVKTSSLGDVIHNLPVVNDLLAHMPDAKIDWMVEENFADLVRLHPGVRNVIPVAVRRWRKALLSRQTWREIGALRQRLEPEQYDLIIDSQGLIKSALLASQAHGLRCGFSRETAREPIAARWYDREYDIPRRLHAVMRNRWLAAAVSEQLPPDNEPDYGLQVTPLQAEWLSTAHPYVVLLTATSRADKQWAREHWLTLANALHQQGLRAILPAGSDDERRFASQLAADMPYAIAAPPLSLPQLAGLMQGATAVIGVDTGLTHLAAALCKPTVALFSASDPELTGVVAGRSHTPALAWSLGKRAHPPTPAEVIAALNAAGVLQ